MEAEEQADMTPHMRLWPSLPPRRVDVLGSPPKVTFDKFK